MDVVYFNPYNVLVSGQIGQEAAAGVLTVLGKIMTGKIMTPELFFKLLAVRFVCLKMLFLEVCCMGF